MDTQATAMGSNLVSINNESHQSWFQYIFNWTLSSPQKLRESEKCLLSHLATPYQGFYVDIGHVVGAVDTIWTVCLNDRKVARVPIVALHGLGSALALWLLNLDALANDRAVYAIDILGFGRSSRPVFSADPIACERQLVEALEEWRAELRLERIILLGHSMGAFIASSYALTYPHRVQHLILSDAWGFAQRPQLPLEYLPLWVRILGRASLLFNPYWILRAVGPLGPCLVHAAAPELLQHFKPVLGEHLQQLTHYIHQCNAGKPSGESAFHTLSENFAFAKRPMIHRIKSLPANVAITFIYGAQSWVDSATGFMVKTMRKDSSVDVVVLDGAGHHAHVEQSELFNHHVKAACKIADANCS